MKKVIIFGAGGLAQEACQYLQEINKISLQFELLGFSVEDPFEIGKKYNGVEVIGGLETVKKLNYNNDTYAFCAVSNPTIKNRISKQIEQLCLKTFNIIHPSAYVSSSVKLGSNILIGPLCVLTTNIVIGDYVIINPQCGIGHNSTIKCYSTLYWNVNISGSVSIGKNCEMGSKSFVKQNLTVGDNVIAGAGSIIVKNIPDNQRVKGVPAEAY